MPDAVPWPDNGWEWFLDSWPPVMGYWLLGGVALGGLLVVHWKKGLPTALVALPLIWLAWEVIAATQTQIPRFNPWPIVVHFGSCVVCFYLGLFSLSGAQRVWPFWAGIMAGLFFVLCSGLMQHFGGLEDSQKYWYIYIYPKLTTVDPNLIKKMASNRIFATLFYPNTLAGVILMLFPATLAALWSMRERLTTGARVLLMSLVGVAMLACLYWTGSRSGWLLMLLVGFLGALFLPLRRPTKIALVAALLGLGLAGFAVKNMAYFKKGATSVNERFHYWQAAVAITKDNPVFGSGPGTFGKSYARRKQPEYEMAQVAHNDFLQQASDSGLPGFLSYAAMVIGTLTHVWRRAGLRQDWLKLAIWLGLVGAALQSLVEFGLYIPAMAWPAFGLMGWLLGQCRNPIDTGKPAS